MRPKITLALTTLAIIALVGLLTNTARADTLRINLSTLSQTTGYLSMYSGWPNVLDSACTASYSDITRGYYTRDGRDYPWESGFSKFQVPQFSALMTPVCSLHYYQSGHSGSPTLVVDWIYDINYTPIINDTLFWHIWNHRDTIIATDNTSADGWHVVSLTPWSCNEIMNMGAQGGGTLFAGWLYPDFVANTYADVVSSGSSATYIKVTYTPKP